MPSHEPTPIIIDCDPGYDDALALLVALASDRLDVIGVSTVGGNVGLDVVTDNARRILAFAADVGWPGAGELAVAVGAAQPLVRRLETAEDVHGPAGLDGPQLPDHRAPLHELDAVEMMAHALRARPAGSVTLVPIGPLTNIALLAQRHPDLVERVASVVLMGGSTRFGNTNAVAEFNIFVDPEAAAVVFDAGWPVTMVGLDVTSLATADEAVLTRIRRIGGPVAEWIAGMLQGAADRRRAAGKPGGPAVHDVCAVAALLEAGAFELRRGLVEIECEGRFTTGMTVVDFRHTAADRANADVAVGLELDRLWDAVLAPLEARAAGAAA